jgi:hypothetical protein
MVAHVWADTRVDAFWWVSADFHHSVLTNSYHDGPNHFSSRILLSMSSTQMPLADHHSLCLSSLPWDSVLLEPLAALLLAESAVGTADLVGHSGDRSVASWRCYSAAGSAKAMGSGGHLSTEMRSVDGMPSFGVFARNILRTAQTYVARHRARSPSLTLSDWHRWACRGLAGCNALGSPSRDSWCSSAKPRTAWLARDSRGL